MRVLRSVFFFFFFSQKKTPAVTNRASSQGNDVAQLDLLSDC